MITAFPSIDPKLAALAGGVGSAVLAAFGYLAKIRYERKRTLRVSLFYLLQLRHCEAIEELIAEELPERLLAAFNTALAERSVQLESEDFSSILASAKPILLSGAERQSIHELKEIREQLQKSLGDLARDLPILAYRLSMALPDVNPANEVEIMSAAGFPVSDPMAQAISNSVRVGIHAEAAQLSKRNLDRLIRMASLEIGLLAYAETRLILRRQDRLKVPEAFFEAMARPMAVCIQELVNAHARSVAGAPVGDAEELVSAAGAGGCGQASVVGQP